MNIKTNALALILSFSAAFLMLGAGTAAAAVMTFTIEEVGDDVVINAEGSFDLTGLQRSRAGTLIGNFFDPFRGTLTVGPEGFTPTDIYDIEDGLFLSFGNGGFQFPDITSGDRIGLGLAGDNDFIYVPAGYTSLSSLAATAIILNDTFASLGITPGRYEFSFLNNTVILDIGAAEVPLPAAAWLFLAGLTALGAVRRKDGLLTTKRKRQASA